MPSAPRQPVNRSLLWLIAGLFAGAVGFLYFWKRRTGLHHRQEKSLRGKAPFIPEPHPGDILLFHNAKGTNKLITLFTKSPFYHAALYAGHNKTVEARTSGVVRGDLTDRENDYVVVPAPGGKGKAALAWAETQVGDGYDDLDVAIIILDRLCRFLRFNYTPHNKYSCGEFVAAAFAQAGVPLVPESDLKDVVPGDLARLLPVEERYTVR